jgi:hypothetical protein
MSRRDFARLPFAGMIGADLEGRGMDWKAGIAAAERIAGAWNAEGGPGGAILLFDTGGLRGAGVVEVQVDHPADVAAVAGREGAGQQVHRVERVGMDDGGEAAEVEGAGEGRAAQVKAAVFGPGAAHEQGPERKGRPGHAGQGLQGPNGVAGGAGLGAQLQGAEPAAGEGRLGAIDLGDDGGVAVLDDLTL